MNWRQALIRPGEWELRADGIAVGTFTMFDNVPTTGTLLHASVRAGVLCAAFRDFDETLVLDQSTREGMEIVAAGWESSDAYRAEVAANRALVDQFPAAVRAAVATAYAAHGWPRFISPTRMTEWQDELLELLAAHERSQEAA